jgi:hypothetical protein
MGKKDDVNEGADLSLTGKLFFASLGAWLIGRTVKTKLRGTPDEIRVVANALMSSRRFQDELRRPGASVGSVMEKLKVKQMSADEFERVFGIPWPLLGRSCSEGMFRIMEKSR